MLICWLWKQTTKPLYFLAIYRVCLYLRFKHRCLIILIAGVPLWIIRGESHFAAKASEWGDSSPPQLSRLLPAPGPGRLWGILPRERALPRLQRSWSTLLCESISMYHSEPGTVSAHGCNITINSSPHLRLPQDAYCMLCGNWSIDSCYMGTYPGMGAFLGNYGSCYCVLYSIEED